MVDRQNTGTKGEDHGDKGLGELLRVPAAPPGHLGMGAGHEDHRSQAGSVRGGDGGAGPPDPVAAAHT